jgi:hypothetical protein
MHISGQAIGGRVTTRGPAMPQIPRMPQATGGAGRQAAVRSWGGQVNITDSVIDGGVEASGGAQMNIDRTVITGPDADGDEQGDADFEAG